MFDEYTLLADTDTAIDICDGHDLDDILNRFEYAEYMEYTTRTFYDIEDKNNG